MRAEPSDEELRAFVSSMLSNLDKRLREPDVVDEAVRAHREMWVKLYLASSGFDQDRLKGVEGESAPSAPPS